MASAVTFVGRFVSRVNRTQSGRRYIGLILLATRVLPFHTPAAVAAATLVTAALFNPLRKSVQHLVDRRLNRSRYDAGP